MQRVKRISEVLMEEQNLLLEAKLKIGDKFIHPIFKDLKGKVEKGPDTYSAIEKAGYDVPSKEELEDAKIDNSELNKKVWYGVKTTSDVSIGIHGNDIIKESAKFKSIDNFSKFLVEIESMSEDEIREIMKEDYIETPGFYLEECDNFESVDVFMEENMYSDDLHNLHEWWMSNVQEIPHLSEARNVSVKRRYTNVHPSIDVQRYAPVREKVLNFIGKAGCVSRKQLLEFLKGMNEELGKKTSMRWVSRNAKYIREYETNGQKHYKLTEVGRRVLNKIHLNED